MPLIDNLIKKDKKGIFKYNNYFTNYSTGFPSLDYLNAFKVKYIDKKTGKEKYLLLPGVMSGRFITIFGGSGGGKTTIATQIGWNIIKPFEDGVLAYTDCEHATYKPRIYDITDCKEGDLRFVLNDEETYIETVMDQIAAIAKEKEVAGEDAMYEVDAGPLEEVFGVKKYKMYVPSVVIIDSLPSFVSKDMKQEMESQTSAQRETAYISQFYKKALGVCSKYNIIVIAINHLKPKIQMQAFNYTPPQLMMLKSDEVLPRGEAPIFYASTMLRMNPSASKAKAFTVEEHGFDGFLCCLQIAKTKTTFIGGEVNLVFREDMGYDPVYSLYQFAYDAGILMGRNPYLYIQGAENFKFNKKNFREKFINEKDFQDAVMAALQPYFDAIAGCKDEECDTNIDITKLMVINEKGEIEAANVGENSNNELVVITPDQSEQLEPQAA